ncbi:MAG: hypothetical protein ABSA85_04590 [Terracidiphilus sp.]
MADPHTNKASRTADAGGAGSGVTRNGVPLLPLRPPAPRVTTELVRQLEQELQ